MDRNTPLVAPEVIEAAMARAHLIRSQMLRDGFAALTGRGRPADTPDQD